MVNLRGIIRTCTLMFAALCVAKTTPSPDQLAVLGKAFETSQHASPDLAWYKAPENFTSSLEPGTPLKIEDATDLTNYTVPGGLSMSRIIYTTLDANGRVLPASAYILWPYHALDHGDDKGYDVALWAHGTSGLFEPCAPSNYRSLQYHFMVPYLLANQGMAVVAPDYAGLGVGSFANGTKIYHPWATSPAQANDMAYALTAARAAFPQYLKPNGSFVAMGHSQGGRVSWGFAERQAVKPVAGYRGTVLVAPAGSPLDIIKDAVKNPKAPWAIPALALQTLTIGAVNAVYPSYNLSGLTDQTLDIYKNAFERYEVCLPTSNLLFGPLLANITKPGWQDAPQVEAWANLTRVGDKRFAGPVLLIAGNSNGSDGIIPYEGYPSAILSTVDDLCHLVDAGGWEQSLEVVGFKNVTHFPVIQASENLWLDWIKRRLNGAVPEPARGCSIGSVEAFRGGKDTVQALSPNFLLTAVNTTDAWETSL
jgi:pimeloyl-ACP methyl ester carboxylesterase